MILLNRGIGIFKMEMIERNKNSMKKFETMINTADENLAEELISDKASFFTPASSEPLYGGKGYLSVVHWMRKGFSDVQWHITDLVAGEDKVAVKWELTGTHNGEFMGISPTNKKISVCVMNFYYFNNEGKIINDVAAEGMIGILRGIDAIK
jgi:predicted ester cyclase